MRPTSPGPLDDCLRDWEELQQDFQSIQVSGSAGAHWPRAMSLWLGVIGRAAVCLAAGNRGQELGTLASFLRAAMPGVPESRGPAWTRPSASCQCPTEAHFARAAAETPATPLRLSDLGPPARASERGPDPNLAFLQKNGRLSQRGRAQGWVSHSANTRWAPPDPSRE